VVRRTTLAGIAPLRNAGPAFAAVAIAFSSDPEILAALSGILVVGLVVTIPAAARLAASRPQVDAPGATADGERT
jgi:BASS family bile acid:Na+ symporter